MTRVRLETATPRSRVKHSTTEPLRDHRWNTHIPLNVFFLILANSADPDEMQHCAAFHRGLHCLQTYPFRCFQCTKV